MAARAAKNKERKYCQTIIPHDWPKMTGPSATYNVEKDRSAWNKYLRSLDQLGPTPRIYGGKA